MNRVWTSIYATCMAIAATSAARADAILTDVVIVDIETGTLAPGQSVLVEGPDIAAIGTYVAADDSIPRIAEAGGYLIPGL